MPRLVFGALPARAADFDDARVCDAPAAVPRLATSLLDQLQQRLSTDEALAESLQSGNNDALTVLFKRYSPRLFGIARRILRNDAEAEDAIQQIFIDVFRAIHRFDPAKGGFKTWLMMFAYQRIFNCRRSLAANRFFETDSFDEFLPDRICKPERLPGQSIAEMSILIEQALGQLQPRQRQTIELVYYEGLTADEVALRTGETVRVVRHNLYRGLERLRKAYTGSASSADVVSRGVSK